MWIGSSRNREVSDWGRTRTRDRTRLGWPEAGSVVELVDPNLGAIS